MRARLFNLSYIRLPSLFVLLALTAFAALAQDHGEVMQIFERAEKQVKQLNQTASLARNQMMATKEAVASFTKADSPAAIESATRQSLAEFRKTENALENLGRLLVDLADSFGGLDEIKESEEGARQIESLNVAIDNANQVFSSLAQGEGIEGSLATLSEQQLNLIKSRLESDQQAKLRQEARRRQNNADQSSSNLERLSEVLARLSVMAQLLEVKNSVNRELVLAMALRNAPNVEVREKLTGIIGDFGAPREMVERIDALASDMAELTSNLIRSLFEEGAGFPDFSMEEIEAGLEALNRAREETCEQCTDGIDNDLDGKIDEEEGPGCKLFVDLDPNCATANLSR